MNKSWKRILVLAAGNVQWFALAGGVIYLVLWIVAEAGRYGILEKTVVFAIFAVAIGISGWWPLVSLGIVTAVPVLQFAGVLYPPVSQTWPMYEAAGIVAFVVAVRGEGLVRKLVLPVGILTSILFAARMMIPSIEGGYWTSWVGGGSNFSGYPHREGLIMLILVAAGFYAAMWSAGIAIRSLLRVRAIGTVLDEAEDRLIETDFELRLAQDRARISRDVHDALAHSLAVIVSQAEGAAALAGQKPRVATAALQTIASVGRTALVDVRSLVERIHDDDVTVNTPTIDDLGAVVAQMRKLGMDATLQVLGSPRPLATTHDLAVFRIVQESLTNALKHAGASSTARVTLDWQGTGLAVLVVSKAPTEPPVPGPGRGVGIRGMMERARLTGGWLTAEREDNDFVVTAFIPVAPIASPPEIAEARDA